MKAIEVSPTVYRYDIPILKYLLFGRDTVYDLLIYRHAKAPRKPLIPFERGRSAVIPDQLFGCRIDLRS